ncbi:hypothetical protein SPRG_13387 [Saprolegnia parasitica CBS 223.65]|uniref:ADP-ribosylation factor n=1 Tax=Saprolegnia parasitica (strain CBS 223.65) TaxID=695850 RepID=A0A067C4V2_SAPPC|nr:hypothetical protein SPRG_13387 [Saprolegnia parasitica CBS 223.65]KDO21576.1 hypothetical protein SPRG_13387 [Saprolegnia parasitica CBS 223.65]|eukprot:XP_012207753.1 hypothetical protein SPRG_13387 [Saprolegnia parasitica CBS 223.65]
MGSISSAVSRLFASNHETRVIMVGLDTAGKSTILYQLRLGESITTIPTIGFNVEQVQLEGFNFTLWDIGPPLDRRTALRQQRKSCRSIRQRWFVQPCCAVTGAGLYEGLHWIATALGAPSPSDTATIETTTTIAPSEETTFLQFLSSQRPEWSHTVPVKKAGSASVQ